MIMIMIIIITIIVLIIWPDISYLRLPTPSSFYLVIIIIIIIVVLLFIIITIIISYLRLTQNSFISIFGQHHHHHHLRRCHLHRCPRHHHHHLHDCHDHHISGIVGTITGTILSIVAIVQCFREPGSCSASWRYYFAMFCVFKLCSSLNAHFGHFAHVICGMFFCF